MREIPGAGEGKGRNCLFVLRRVSFGVVMAGALGPGRVHTVLASRRVGLVCAGCAGWTGCADFPLVWLVVGTGCTGCPACLETMVGGKKPTFSLMWWRECRVERSGGVVCPHLWLSNECCGKGGALLFCEILSYGAQYLNYPKRYFRRGLSTQPRPTCSCASLDTNSLVTISY